MGWHEHELGVVGSHWRVRLVEFDCICLRRSVVPEKEEEEVKEDRCKYKPGRNASGGYLECDVRVDTEEEIAGKERKKRKQEGRQRVVFSGNKR